MNIQSFIKKVAIAGALILTLTSTAFAGTTVTLDEAIRAALENNPLVMAKDSAKQAAAEAVGSARSHYFPKVGIEERYMRTDNPTYAFSTKLAQERFTMSDFDIDRLNDPEAIGDYQTSISFEQLLYSKKASVGLKMARVEAQSSAMDFRRAKEKTVLNVYKAYFNVLTAKEYVKATAKGLEDAHENHRVSKLRFDSGLGLYTDTLSADVYLKEVQERQLESEKNLSLARHVLGLSMGLNDSVDAEDIELGFELDGFDQYALASKSRSDIRAMEHRVENARNNVQLAGSDYLPVMGIGGSYQVNSHNAPFEEEG
ncbi:MAG: TolC family protein, partial [Thermodesulfovibrionales bacterium]|nr:TolC family protein [Thermodesulfovibrionales bacterium]